MPSQRGQPVQIFWSPTESGSYDDGASKLPCATLLHELTHAWQNYNGEYSNEDLLAFEHEPVRAENWVIWRLLGDRGKQRTTYGDPPMPLPPPPVVWPQARWPRALQGR